MLKFSSLLIGEDYNYTSKFQSSSKRKVILLATSLLIPVILWFITSYLTSRYIMNNSLIVSITIGVICAFIIYLIERTIILSNGGWLIFIFRILLGFTIASLGAVALDSVIFKSDIDNKVIDYKRTYLDSVRKKSEEKFILQITDQKTFVDKLYADFKAAEKNHRDEMQGKAGNSSGMIGNGKIATQLELQVISSKESHLNEKALLEEMKSNKDLLINRDLEEAKNNFNPDGLLLRIRALNDLISEDSNLKKIYWLFTLFIFLLEFIVVIAKVGSKKSIDEEIELFRDHVSMLKINQYKTMLKNSERSLNYLPEIVKAKALLNENRIT